MPVATAPVICRLTSADFPTPGSPKTNSPGLVTSPARSQASGSRQQTSPHSMCRPTGVPSDGVPEPATNGNRPQACVVVAWYSGAALTCAARPAPGTFHPQAGGTCPGGRAGPAAGGRPDGGRVPVPAGCRPGRAGRALFSVVMTGRSSRLVRYPAGQLGGADAEGEGGGPPGGLAVGHAAQPDAGGLGGGLGLRDGPGQLGGISDGDGDVQRDQADAGAGGFLGCGLPGAGLVEESRAVSSRPVRRL